jgi:hypothetical protein
MTTTFIQPTIPAFDFLSNTRLGGPFKTNVFISWKMSKEGQANTIRLMVVDPAAQALRGKTGYAGGTGGEIEIEIFQDGVRMGGGRLATLGDYVAFPLNDLFTFSPGHLYTACVMNLADDSTENYSSLDCICAMVPQQGWDGFSVSYQTEGGPLILRPNELPIFSLEGPDGTILSTGWIYADYAAATFASARQWFPAPASDITIAAAWVRGISRAVAGVYPAVPWVRMPYPKPLVCKAGVPFAIPFAKLPLLPIEKWNNYGGPDPNPGGYAEFTNDPNLEAWSPVTGKVFDIQCTLELA